MLDNERSHGNKSDRNHYNPIFHATDLPLSTRSPLSRSLSLFLSLSLVFSLSLSLSLSCMRAFHRELAQLSTSGESREEFHFRLPISIQCGGKIVFSVYRKRLSARNYGRFSPFAPSMKWSHSIPRSFRGKMYGSRRWNDGQRNTHVSRERGKFNNVKSEGTKSCSLFSWGHLGSHVFVLANLLNVKIDTIDRS